MRLEIALSRSPAPKREIGRHSSDAYAVYQFRMSGSFLPLTVKPRELRLKAVVASDPLHWSKGSKDFVHGGCELGVDAVHRCIEKLFLLLVVGDAHALNPAIDHVAGNRQEQQHESGKNQRKCRFGGNNCHRWHYITRLRYASLSRRIGGALFTRFLQRRRTDEPVGANRLSGESVAG